MIIKVSSSSGNGSYEVDTINLTCTCPHYLYRMEKINGMCKHILQTLERLGDVREEALKFILTNNDAIGFIEKYSEDLLVALKKSGQVIEERGRLKCMK